MKRPSFILSSFVFIILVLPAFFLKEKTALFLAKLVWSLVIAFFAYLLFKGSKISKLRSILFIIIAWAFLFQFKFASPKTQGVPFCHIAIVSTFLNFLYNQYLALTSGRWPVWGVLSLGFLWLVITLILGQAWCAWVCFYGGFDDGFCRLLKRPLFKIKLPTKLRDFPLAFTIFIVIISFTAGLPVYCLWFCPLKATTQFLERGDIFIRHLQLFIFIFVALFFVLILPIVLKKRTFCSFLCPFGAFISVFGQLNPFRLTIDKDKCIQCKTCIERCPMFAINEESLARYQPLNYCNRCGECIDVCPTQAIKFTLAGREVRTVFIFCCLLILGALSNLFVPQAFIKLIGMLSGG
ncbi:MAG: 4Fe-4S binding protein [Candidatus Omnitrophica bacterium]|nr:4Fe-4S binding protein [Candidatus Omnitrophota bacterium]